MLYYTLVPILKYTSINKIIKSKLENELNGKYEAIIEDGKITLKSIEEKSGQVKPKIEIKNKEGEFKEVSTLFIDGKDAKPAEIVLNSTALNKTIKVNGVTVDLSSLGEEATMEDRVNFINTKLSDNNVNVNAEIINNQIVLKTNDYGESSSITLSVPEDSGAIYGKSATSAEITGLKIDDLKNNIIYGKASFKIDDNEFSIGIADISTNDDIEKLLNTALSEKGYSAKIDTNGNITLSTSRVGGSGQKHPVVEIRNKDDGNFGIKTTTFISGKDATSAKAILNSDDLNKIIVINGVAIDLTGVNAYTNKDGKEISENEAKNEHINKILEEQKVAIKAEIKGGDIELTSIIKGSNSKIAISSIEAGDVGEGGKDANIIIDNGKGKYTHEGSGNSLILDGITFNFIGEIPNEGIKVTSKQDSTEIVDKIKDYIEDYNKIIEKLNTLINEKMDRVLKS